MPVQQSGIKTRALYLLAWEFREGNCPLSGSRWVEEQGKRHHDKEDHEPNCADADNEPDDPANQKVAGLAYGAAAFDVGAIIGLLRFCTNAIPADSQEWQRPHEGIARPEAEDQGKDGVY